jgi:hypothetical protein
MVKIVIMDTSVVILSNPLIMGNINETHKAAMYKHITFTISPIVSNLYFHC